MAAWLAARGELTPAQERAAMAAGVAQAQEARAAWTRADLIHRIGQNLPDHAVGRDQEHAVRYLEALADRALAGEAGEQVRGWTRRPGRAVPESLRRADGESIYRPPGLARYATEAQLSMEQRLVCQAQPEDAPHLPREDAARLLGADRAAVEAQIRAGRRTRPRGTAAAGLRLDQATAAYLALTSPRRVEMIVGPAGTGKTYTAVRIAQAWRDAGLGQVMGVATTSAGRNVMLEAGIPAAENTAQFLGHLPGQREARGVTATGPGALLILDEASMTSTPDLAAIIRHAAKSGCQGHHHRGSRTACRGRVRRRDGNAGPQARLRPAHRGRPVPGTGGRATPRLVSAPGTWPRSGSTTSKAGFMAAAMRRWPSGPAVTGSLSTWPEPMWC